MFTNVYYCLLMFAIPIYSCCSFNQVRRPLLRTWLQSGPSVQSFFNSKTEPWTIAFIFEDAWVFVHICSPIFSTGFEVSTCFNDPRVVFLVKPWAMSHFEPSHRIPCFFSCQESKAPPSRSLGRHHRAIKFIGQLRWNEVWAAFTWGGPLYLWDTYTHISFESRTCTGWNLVRILKYLEISLRDSSVNCTILHQDWSLLNVLCPCARSWFMYLHVCETWRTLQVPSWSVSTGCLGRWQWDWFDCRNDVETPSAVRLGKSIPKNMSTHQY